MVNFSEIEKTLKGKLPEKEIKLLKAKHTKHPYNLYLSEETINLLVLEATRLGLTPSSLVSELIRTQIMGSFSKPVKDKQQKNKGSVSNSEPVAGSNGELATGFSIKEHD